ncbi:NAD(P)-dependent dehydrogenase (short-subunit alcohol dehydrogenase family) [Rhodococcus sp. 27YEA15]|uniref:SDR family NAD(P)-dependent oxidoreductase n=1 Tax=Rhodococcus sp. 27YEA15 TaxID=3156259 RepID=UPI003C7E0384
MQQIESPFGFHTTAAEVADGIDLTGKTAIVTGGSSGIGIETARVLAQAGTSVTLAVRNTIAGETVADDLRARTRNGNIVVRPLELADIGSVARFVADWDRPVDLLINNAGIMATPELTKTPEGRELQFATNFLGHFQLSLGLHRWLTQAGTARVVSLTSSGHLISPVVFDDLDFKFRPYDPWAAYGQSKTANALLAVAITQRWAQDGITSNAVMPGAIATGLQKHTGGLRTPVEWRKTVEQGAATTIFAAVSPLLEGIGGHYLEDVADAQTVTERAELARGVAPYALDKDNADRLWDLAENLVHTRGTLA